MPLACMVGHLHPRPRSPASVVPSRASVLCLLPHSFPLCHLPPWDLMVCLLLGSPFCMAPGQPVRPGFQGGGDIKSGLTSLPSVGLCFLSQLLPLVFIQHRLPGLPHVRCFAPGWDVSRHPPSVTALTRKQSFSYTETRIPAAGILVKHFLQDLRDGLFLISLCFWDAFCEAGRPGDVALLYKITIIVTVCQARARCNTGQPLYIILIFAVTRFVSSFPGFLNWKLRLSCSWELAHNKTSTTWQSLSVSLAWLIPQPHLRPYHAFEEVEAQSN